MSDYSEHGAQPVDDAVVDDPPTEGEVRAEQERRFPDQAATRLEGAAVASDEERLGDAADAGDVPDDFEVTDPTSQGPPVHRASGGDIGDGAD